MPEHFDERTPWWLVAVRLGAHLGGHAGNERGPTAPKLDVDDEPGPAPDPSSPGAYGEPGKQGRLI
jgi:hypothetical protein